MHLEEDKLGEGTALNIVFYFSSIISDLAPQNGNCFRYSKNRVTMILNINYMLQSTPSWVGRTHEHIFLVELSIGH